MDDAAIERAVDAALAADDEWIRRSRSVVFASPARDQVRVMLEAAAPPILAAERARLSAELKEHMAGFLAHYGGTAMESLSLARDLEEGVCQILDREPSGD